MRQENAAFVHTLIRKRGAAGNRAERCASSLLLVSGNFITMTSLLV